MRRAAALTGPLARTRYGDGGRGGVAGAGRRHRPAVADLPGDPALRAPGGEGPGQQAARLDATDLARAGRHLVTVVDPDSADRRLEAALEREERAAHADRYLTITPDGAGGVRVKGRGISRGRRPAPGRPAPAHLPRSLRSTSTTVTGPVYDPRDDGTRLWDALVPWPSTPSTPTRSPTPTAPPPDSSSPSTTRLLRRVARPGRPG